MAGDGGKGVKWYGGTIAGGKLVLVFIELLGRGFDLSPLGK
jgi:hypothetical protein